MEARRLPDGTALYHTYDAAGNRTAVEVSGVGTSYYEHDALGRVRALTTPAGKTAYYSYDAEGAITEKKWPSDAVTSFAYDAAGRPTSINHAASDGTEIAYFGYAYSPGGNVESIRLEAGRVIYYDYDHRSRLTGEQWRDAAGESIYAYQYDYDGAGNRTRKAFNGAETYYEYDSTNRLTRAHAVPADTYTYYSYDPRGNTTEIKDPAAGTTYFEYNDRDLAESIHYPGGAWNRFHYDAQGRRYAMEDSSGLTYFTWDENGMNLLCERDATGAVTRKYAHGPTPVDGIGSVVEIEDTGTASFKYPHMDHRGTVVATTGAGQAQKDAYEWNAWGERLHESETGFAHLLGYQTNWMMLPDSAGKVIITPTRSYGPESARFLQVDPVGYQTGNVNLLEYVSNNPVNQVDNLGLTEISMAHQTAWQNIFSRMENWLRQFIKLPKIAAAGHYLQVWGRTSDGCDFFTYGKDSARGRYTFVPLGASYTLQVCDTPTVSYKKVPKKQCADCKVMCVTCTSEMHAFVGVEWGRFNLSVRLVGSTIAAWVCADGTAGSRER